MRALHCWISRPSSPITVVAAGILGSLCWPSLASAQRPSSPRGAGAKQARVARSGKPKLGYLDLGRAFQETEEGNKTRASLGKVRAQKQRELDEQQKEI